jgi:fluoroquinolone transport system permease protein
VKRLGSLLRWDATLQARHHVFTANVVSTLALCGLVALIPPASLTPPLASFVLFADPALIGLSFVGAVVLMERGARESTWPSASRRCVRGSTWRRRRWC